MNKEEYKKIIEERNKIKENITKERLLKLCFEMHKWIFLHSGDEQSVYDELGFTDEENFLFGYSGQIVMFDSKLSHRIRRARKKDKGGSNE